MQTFYQGNKVRVMLASDLPWVHATYVATDSINREHVVRLEGGRLMGFRDEFLKPAENKGYVNLYSDGTRTTISTGVLHSTVEEARAGADKGIKAGRHLVALAVEVNLNGVSH